ncbi:MAG: PIG-L deacetylase family protein [Lachnospiraceae bacterium]|jgi:4-oxalomesaconate hydratase
MMKDDILLVISAHSADWVWRSSGTIAKYLEAGAKVVIVCLTYGVRGESTTLWKVEGQTAEGVRAARSEESHNAAAVLGVTDFEMWDFDDCMLQITPEILQKLNEKIREVKPTLIITHDEGDSTNLDHAVAHTIVMQALKMATQAGVPSNGLNPIKNVPVYGFEASEPERSGYRPDIYINITTTFDKKVEAMKCIKAQKEGPFIHTRLSTHRGWQGARTVLGMKEMEYAESFKMFFPLAVEELPSRK